MEGGRKGGEVEKKKSAVLSQTVEKRQTCTEADKLAGACRFYKFSFQACGKDCYLHIAGHLL